jgi:hypothetical protein
MRAARPSSLAGKSAFWDSPLVTTLRNRPVNCVIIALCVYIWNSLRVRRWGWEEVGCSYRNVLLEGQVCGGPRLLPARRGVHVFPWFSAFLGCSTQSLPCARMCVCACVCVCVCACVVLPVVAGGVGVRIPRGLATLGYEHGISVPSRCPGGAVWKRAVPCVLCGAGGVYHKRQPGHLPCPDPEIWEGAVLRGQLTMKTCIRSCAAMSERNTHACTYMHMGHEQHLTGAMAQKARDVDFVGARHGGTTRVPHLRVAVV